MPINEKFRDIMAEELTVMKESAEIYIKDKILNSHPEVAEFIQSRKAATSLLEFQKGRFINLIQNNQTNIIMLLNILLVSLIKSL